MVPGACHDGAEADTAPPEETGEAEALIAPEEALMGSVPELVHAPEVGQTREGATKASPANAVMARTSEPELPTFSTIGGSTPEGASVMEEVPLASVGPTPTVAMGDPLVGARPSWSLF